MGRVQYGVAAPTRAKVKTSGYALNLAWPVAILLPVRMIPKDVYLYAPIDVQNYGASMLLSNYVKIIITHTLVQQTLIYRPFESLLTISVLIMVRFPARWNTYVHNNYIRYFPLRNTSLLFDTCGSGYTWVFNDGFPFWTQTRIWSYAFLVRLVDWGRSKFFLPSLGCMTHLAQLLTPEHFAPGAGLGTKDTREICLLEFWFLISGDLPFTCVKVILDTMCRPSPPVLPRYLTTYGWFISHIPQSLDSRPKPYISSCPNCWSISTTRLRIETSYVHVIFSQPCNFQCRDWREIVLLGEHNKKFKDKTRQRKEKRSMIQELKFPVNRWWKWYTECK